jgi:hypothetical protein
MNSKLLYRPQMTVLNLIGVPFTEFSQNHMRHLDIGWISPVSFRKCGRFCTIRYRFGGRATETQQLTIPLLFGKGVSLDGTFSMVNAKQTHVQHGKGAFRLAKCMCGNHISNNRESQQEM